MISRALHVLDLMRATIHTSHSIKFDRLNLGTHHEAHLPHSCGHAEGTASHHALHMQCDQRKCLCTERTSSTPEFDEVMNVLPTTPELHVHAGPQRQSQATATNGMCKQVVAVAVIISIGTWKHHCIRVWNSMHHS